MGELEPSVELLGEPIEFEPLNNGGVDPVVFTVVFTIGQDTTWKDVESTLLSAGYNEAQLAQKIDVLFEQIIKNGWLSNQSVRFDPLIMQNGAVRPRVLYFQTAPTEEEALTMLRELGETTGKHIQLGEFIGKIFDQGCLQGKRFKANMPKNWPDVAEILFDDEKLYGLLGEIGSSADNHEIS